MNSTPSNSNTTRTDEEAPPSKANNSHLSSTTFSPKHPIKKGLSIHGPGNHSSGHALGSASIRVESPKPTAHQPRKGNTMTTRASQGGGNGNSGEPGRYSFWNTKRSDQKTPTNTTGGAGLI